ncbi:hypothetical protein MXB_3500, partial [Myxobolus squamalis]
SFLQLKHDQISPTREAEPQEYWLVEPINLSRRKPPPTSSPRGFSRCLSTFELTSLGVGAILGAGVYVVAGQVAASIAGPSTFLSFIIAAFASILSGLAYAEFGARVPRTTGSAYAYSYVAVGEIWAFVIGWNLLLEYMIGTAADASALSASIENLASNIFGNTSSIFYPFPPIVGNHNPDILAFILTLLVTFLLAVGVRDSTRCTLVCNVINVCVILFIVILGSFYADPSRWKGYDNFFPFGVGGTLSGAASCFYAFVGFDIIATTGEEAADASKSIPIAIVASLIIVLVGYLCVSSVITMMVPYNTLDSRAPLASAFGNVGLRWAGNIISSGAIFGLTSSLIGSLFPLPRIVFSMANDGLLFSIFSKMNPKTEVPINATLYPGIITALFALFFNLEDLVEMMSIGTLLAYTLVSFCVLILRYQPTDVKIENLTNSDDDVIYSLKRTASVDGQETQSNYNLDLISEAKQYINKVIILFGYQSIIEKKWWAIFILTLIGSVIVISFIILNLQPQNNEEISFKAPFVPTLPVVAILFNIFLILKLSFLTWIRFSVWMTIGVLLYIFYSYKYSKLAQCNSVDT